MMHLCRHSITVHGASGARAGATAVQEHAMPPRTSMHNRQFETASAQELVNTNTIVDVPQLSGPRGDPVQHA